MSPGPSFVMVSNLSLARGRRAPESNVRRAWVSAILIYASLSLLGLGLVLKEIPILMIAVKILGGLYLIYIGVLILRSSLKAQTLPIPASVPTPEKNQNAFLLGLLTNLNQSKVIVFYGSILSVAMGPNSNAMTKVLMVPFCGSIVFLWYGFVASRAFRTKVARTLSEMGHRYRSYFRDGPVPVWRFADFIGKTIGLKT